MVAGITWIMLKFLKGSQAGALLPKGPRGLWLLLELRSERGDTLLVEFNL